MKLEEKIAYLQSLIEDADDELRAVGKRMESLKAAKSHLGRELRKMTEEKESMDAMLQGAKIGGSLPVVEDTSTLEHGTKYEEDKDYSLMVERGGSIKVNPMRGHETPKMEGKTGTRKVFGKSPLDVIAEERIGLTIDTTKL